MKSGDWAQLAPPYLNHLFSHLFWVLRQDQKQRLKQRQVTGRTSYVAKKKKPVIFKTALTNQKFAKEIPKALTQSFERIQGQTHLVMPESLSERPGQLQPCLETREPATVDARSTSGHWGWQAPRRPSP